MRKTALIVDDSRTARVVLTRMLQAHSLAVDTAENAEKAIEYLNDHRPDVIFMDHMMPGMDGLEAVKAIKNNPATATIPIMMYTSQKGEVYVGQARALGAVGVLPKEVEPVEVSKVLASLRVIEANTDRRSGQATAEPGQDDKPAGLEHLDKNIRNLVQDLFEQQRAILLRDLQDSSESITTRVINEIRSPVDEGYKRFGRIPRRRATDKLKMAVTALAMLVLILGWLYWDQYQRWEEMREQNDGLLKALAHQQTVLAAGNNEIHERLNGYQQSMGSAYNSALQALEWGINQSVKYNYGEIPLGEERLPAFEALLSQLLELGFSGQVRVDSHVGDFCLTETAAGGYALAASSLAVIECDLIGFQANDALETGQQQSVTFTDFVNDLQQQTAGRIRFDFVSLGNSDPLVSYPVPGVEVTAAEWNRIAMRNNRIQVSLYPD